LAEVKTLPDKHHVMRYVPYARCEKDEQDNIIGFLPQAFELREGEDYLSAAWVEYFEKPDHGTRVEATIFAFREQPRPKVGAKSRFAVGNCGKIKAACKRHNQRVRISHEPVDGFDSHASLRQFKSSSLELLELLATDTWAEMYLPTMAPDVA
jgi:hypothetical protein